MIDRSISELQNWFSNHQQIMIALSGGVDSSLVAYMARLFKDKKDVLAVISDSSSLKRKDLQEAIEFCESYDISYHILKSDPIVDNNYASNPDNRCYFCKTFLYEAMIKLRNEEYPEFTMVNGNNADDKGDYRPGLEAAKENNALSPLMDCNINKETIRAIARHYNLKIWNKPASPCLSSRFPYGTAITINKLNMVEVGENLLNSYGFADCRVRYYKGVAKLEVQPEEMEKLIALSNKLKTSFMEWGFTDIEIDKEGLISGKLNRALGFKVVRE
ncbi:ATP-dependent sacrificial sulfur transferase LarE [Carboxylicivirga linearis]|uniref:ATP-dependent sacrificial sulfur transferase LarE n=1 Tax=Carboxylicivirga linearis TaxID=1628157 RepID=A0ABS5JZ87_9BACT|nr:ATP-dependent sacrificial sulfur transferase LarE [Carboxylicivirga linearis]MBS2100176.1 ATP-dependent sacrificial sulfur transferase LarE [Carboxylicivirga linearis]